MMIDPNLVYLGLIVGLWVGVTAVYITGTGIPEILSFVLIAGSLYVLTQMPTNWLAVVLMVVGFSGFLIAPFTSPRVGQFAEIGLGLQAVGSLLLFNGALNVSPLVIVPTLLVAWGYHRFLLLPIMRTQREESFLQKEDRVIGARGRVVTAIDPVGTVYVNGEHWTAHSQDAIPAGMPILVTGQRGLELEVEKAKREDPLAEGNGWHK
ncbi:hypothetical protein G4Y79_03300 [Phototrophicus methaneseepsis]|uniref:NfeD-like C-terminal domain-containing protein n=1 Tax=Phototrophicus methaneseepsis TaxID=2710758 RepID=A0A7S8EAU7_9CHLR|nr:NfeD family protein [Phototrophicus methaneseepsis]QPC83423.1 hypothetical protein G4Y79_03300 [Phototrophicus methaneseepsis]